MKDLLIEILVEEIPADFAYPASLSFKKIIENTLKNNGLNFKSITSFTTPRRLSILVEEAEEKSKDDIIESKGPLLESAIKDGVLTKAGEGFLKANNIEIKNIKDIEVYKSVSFLSQSSEIYFDYNVFDTVMLGRYANFKDKLLSIPSKEDKEFVFECLEKLNIIHLKDKLINRLSGGELQKVFLARAFAQNPKIILMDEPTNHLDLNSQIELIYNLKEWVNKDFRCIIAVMHDINNALNFADKILLLHKGEIIYFGDIENFNLELLNNVYNINVVEYMRNSLKNIR